MEIFETGIWIAWAFRALYVFGTCRKTDGGKAKQYITVSCSVGRLLMSESGWGQLYWVPETVTIKAHQSDFLTVITKEKQPHGYPA